MRVLVTRPLVDCKGLIDALADLGHEGVPAPLLDVVLIDGDELNLDGVQGMLFTSANGARAFAGRSAERDLPALCVGDATAREALALGFETVKSAAGDVDALAALTVQELKPTAGTVLHPAGSRVAGDLAGMVEAAGFTYRREVLYQAIKAGTLPDAALGALAANAADAVVMYSPRTASTFAGLVDKAGLNEHLKTVDAYCLSDAVADQIKDLAWRKIFVAAHPDQASLLALLGT